MVEAENNDEMTIPRFSPNGHGRSGETWKVVTLIITLVGLIFTAGYNWRRVDETASAQTAMETDLKTNYVRRDVQEQQLRNIDGRLLEIKDLIQRIEEARRRDAASR